MKNIYIVCQTQTSENIKNCPVYALDNKALATKYVRALNKQYAYGVNLTSKGDFIDILEDDHHYYDIIVLKLNEKL